jgi:hypothetical protein
MDLKDGENSIQLAQDSLVAGSCGYSYELFIPERASEELLSFKQESQFT